MPSKKDLIGFGVIAATFIGLYLYLKPKTGNGGGPPATYSGYWEYQLGGQPNVYYWTSVNGYVSSYQDSIRKIQVYATKDINSAKKLIYVTESVFQSLP